MNDGLVLAADSATTLVGQDPETGQPGVFNVYNHANKVFNLVKGLPIGVITWGSGAIGTSSISTLVKDLRQLMQPEKGHPDWSIDPQKYRIDEIAKTFRKFIFDEQYLPAFSEWKGERPSVGFIVAGYSTDESMAEEYAINIVNGECPEPSLVRPMDDSGMTWNGEPEAITRLILGFGSGLPSVLKEHLGVPEEQIPSIMTILQQQLAFPLIQNAMPFQDAIDLAEFLVDMTIKFSRFSPGAPTVGGTIEIAAISKHEGFKWVRRKHYYSRELNPEGRP